MRARLLPRALAKFAAGAVLMGLLLFLPAGTLRWREGWRLMALLFIAMFIAGLILLRVNPALLEKRLNAREDEAAQKGVIALSGLMFAGGFALCGLDYRFGWSRLPGWVPWAAAAAFLLAYGLYGEVLRENAWLSRTVEVQEGQRVVDTGLYGVVRHPMYAATLPLFLSMPLALGSLAGLAVFLIYPVILVPRILNEERVLAEGLPGYADYMKKVRWRLVPLVW